MISNATIFLTLCARCFTASTHPASRSLRACLCDPGKPSQLRVEKLCHINTLNRVGSAIRGEYYFTEHALRLLSLRIINFMYVKCRLEFNSVVKTPYKQGVIFNSVISPNRAGLVCRDHINRPSIGYQSLGAGSLSNSVIYF